MDKNIITRALALSPTYTHNTHNPDVCLRAVRGSHYLRETHSRKCISGRRLCARQISLSSKVTFARTPTSYLPLCAPPPPAKCFPEWNWKWERTTFFRACARAFGLFRRNEAPLIARPTCEMTEQSFLNAPTFSVKWAMHKGAPCI